VIPAEGNRIRGTDRWFGISTARALLGIAPPLACIATAATFTSSAIELLTDPSVSWQLAPTAVVAVGILLSAPLIAGSLLLRSWVVERSWIAYRPSDEGIEVHRLFRRETIPWNRVTEIRRSTEAPPTTLQQVLGRGNREDQMHVVSYLAENGQPQTLMIHPTIPDVEQLLRMISQNAWNQAPPTRGSAATSSGSGSSGQRASTPPGS